MTRKNNRKTPLGDKFDEADFPIEPSAWSEMATLLPSQNPKGPLSIFGKFGFFIASIPLIFIAFWQLSSEFSSDKKTELAAAETLLSQDKKSEKNNKNLIEFNEINSKENALKSDLIDNKTALELDKTALKTNTSTLNSSGNKTVLQFNKATSKSSDLSGSIANKTSLELNKTALKSKDLALNSIANKTDLINNKNALINAQLKTNAVGNRAVLTNENVIKNELINSNAQMLNQSVLSLNNSTINPFILGKSDVLKTDSALKNNSDFIVKNTLDSSYAHFNKNSLNALDVSNAENIKTSLNHSEIIDNQGIINKETVSELAFIELRELNSIYSDSFQNINSLEQINALLPTSLIPISQLWRGNHHQISIGFGHASLEFNNHDRPAINRFRVAYNYRVTPLLGIGTSTNYVLINPKGYYSTTEIELNLYFVNRQRFDAFLSAGYGYRQWDFQNNASETVIGRGRGFTLGLNAQYAINRKYTIGFRIDLKQVVEPDFGLLLVFSRCF